MSSKFINNNLLSTYHPRTKYYHYSALGQAFAFFVLASVWIGIVFGAAAGGGITFAWLLPWLLFKFGAELGLSAEVVRQTAEVLAYLAPTVTVATIIPVNALFMVLCERKFLALLTMRTGPTDVGPNGFLQTLADALKLLFKEDTTPAKADFLLFTLAPALFFAPAMVVFMPLLSVASNNLGIFATTNLDIGLIFVIGLASLGTMSLVMEGWASNNKYSLIGGLRAASQAISYEIPMVLALIAIILMSGSMNLVEVSDAQAGGLFQWNIFGNGQILEITNLFASTNTSNIAVEQLVKSGAMNPFLLGLYSAVFVLLCMLLFVIFVTASTAEVNRIPFDIPEAESELVSGFNTECSGMKFALFFLAEYTNLFIASGIAAVLFLGGSHLPISLEAENALYSALSHVAINLPVLGDLGGLLADVNLVWVVTSLVFITKIYLMFLLAIWIRATLPRLRQDQLMEFGWKYLIPLTLGIIFVMTILLEVLGR